MLSADVVDNGIGTDNEAVANVFDLYYRAEKSNDASGFGSEAWAAYPPDDCQIARRPNRERERSLRWHEERLQDAWGGQGFESGCVIRFFPATKLPVWIGSVIRPYMGVYSRRSRQFMQSIRSLR